MTGQVAVVDLFSGPGGLAEGFAALPDTDGHSRFTITLSVEMDQTAYRTLCLRSFLRKFPTGFPPEYYKFLNGEVTQEPDWSKLYTREWREACDETQCLKLGTSEANTIVNRRIKQIRANYGDRIVLLGGPPCQSYSIVGRARNARNFGYDPAMDERQSLYREFAKVLAKLQPSVAVMENVKGILSARHNDRPIFPEVIDSLKNAGGKNRYRLYPLCSTSGYLSLDVGISPSDFLVRAEQHGVPQKRHRVFVVCVRRDVAAHLSEELLPRLNPVRTTVSVKDMIGSMPILRSQLSRNDDDVSWQKVVARACRLIRNNIPNMTRDQKNAFLLTLDIALETTKGTPPPIRGASGGVAFANSCPTALREWIFDEKVTKLPNNETRGHIHEDIARYLYASAFALSSERSPRAADFPKALAPNHASWNSGKFHDRFRVQMSDRPSTTITSHISKDGHYFIHPDPAQCRSLTVREAARLQTFPDNYYFHGGRTQQYVQVGNAVPPYLALQIAKQVRNVLEQHFRSTEEIGRQFSNSSDPACGTRTLPTPLQLMGAS